MTGGAPIDWRGYLDEFHSQSSGITEDLLAPARDETGCSPYEWLLEARGERQARSVDVGCGSAPTGMDTDGWVGVDRSLAELRAGRSMGRTRVVLGDAAQLPFADGSIAVALSSMSLMVVDDPEAMLAEIHRLLAPGGRLLVLVPAAAPLTMRDRLRMGAVMALVGTAGFPFPHREMLRRTAVRIAAAGFEVEDEEARRFAVPLSRPEDGERFVRSLYLPDVPEWRVRLALRAARRWRGTLGIPLRRIVARRALEPPAPVSGSGTRRR